VTNKEKESPTAAPIISEPAFTWMCAVLGLMEAERKLARCAVYVYEIAKRRHHDRH
jgi:hypothetical protein